MSRLQKKESLKEARRRLIIDTAFRIFVEQKIEPVSMGVTTVPLILNMTFMPPPSSTYLRSTPSSQRTCE